MSTNTGNNWRVDARHEIFNGGVAVLIRRGKETFKLVGEGFLRAMLNCAWELGLRPDGFEDTRESMKATARHLEDMRTLAFHRVGAIKPA